MNRIVSAFVALSLVVVTGCGPEQRSAIAPRTSPPVVFDALMTALEAGDFDTAVGCLDPQTTTKTASLFGWRGLEERDRIEKQWSKSPPDDGWGHRRSRLRPSDEEKEQQRLAKDRASRRAAILEKYGLTKETSDTLRRLPTEAAARAAVGDHLCDPAQFLCEFFRACRSNRPEWIREGRARPRLAELRYDGDKATGKMYFQMTAKGNPPVNEVSWDLSFVLVEGDWKVVEFEVFDFVAIPWSGEYFR